jgi:osmoprotectant transport system permease protein
VTGEPIVDWAWIADHLDALAARTVQHLYFTAIAVAVGFAISFGLAVWSVRRRALYAPISAAAGVLYTLPSLALFPIFVPITGLTLLTAEIPLVLYTILIFHRNIVAGFDSVPADVVEAADGMGFTAAQRFWRVDLPLAIPLIGGLGFFIFEGYRRGFPTEIFAGALPSILLAIAVDVVLVAAQRRLTPWAQTNAARRTSTA